MSPIARSGFGSMPDGTAVEAYTLTNAAGMTVRVLTCGGILQEISVPGRDGSFANVELGFDNLGDYLTDSPYFGALVGRFANRIAAARFSLDGADYVLPVNNGSNSLHGGIVGFDKRVWQAEVGGSVDEPALSLHLVSQDGDQGYPGALTVDVTYRLTAGNAIEIDYRATTDKPTICNLTNHAYFNLGGEGTGDVLGHELTIDADSYTPVDDNQIPTGEIAPVAGTPMDFTTPHRIGERIRDGFAQLRQGKGYDHNYVLNRPAGDMSTLLLAARVVEPVSGRVLEVHTTQPGLQLYTGGFLDASVAGTSGRYYRMGDAFCLETQHFPDSPHQPSWPSVVLRPGAVFESRTVYAFSTV